MPAGREGAEPVTRHPASLASLGAGARFIQEESPRPKRAGGETRDSRSDYEGDAHHQCKKANHLPAHWSADVLLRTSKLTTGVIDGLLFFFSPASSSTHTAAASPVSLG